jgi:ATP-dependent protease Clp ATPase subunit
MRDELQCSFCHRGQRDVGKLVAGREALICDACLPAAREVLTDRRPQWPTSAAMWFTDVVDLPCAFCTKRVGSTSRPRRTHPLRGVAAAASAHICIECVELCDAIVEESAREADET